MKVAVYDMGEAVSTDRPQARQPWTDEFWHSADGLKLHYRDYARLGNFASDDRPPILCLPGLTRNARDFEPIADAFAGEWRVICPELRGRGDSDYSKDPETYVPLQYVQDLDALFDHAGLTKVVVVGTSLGGLITMLMATMNPQRLAGVVLNDIGPHIEETGLARIRDYVGQGRSFPTWMHAVWALQESSADIFPDYEINDWLTYAKRLMCVGGNGRITYDYDMKIAEPFTAADPEEAIDMWPAFRALAGRPLLAVRGELSDILSDVTLRKMATEIPEMETVTVPRIGHTPSLAEPEAQQAIARLLAKLA